MRGPIRGHDPREVQARLSYVTRLGNAGFLGRTLLSEDICKAEPPRTNGDTGYEYSSQLQRPTPRAQPWKDELHCLLVDNPRRMLAGG